MKSLKVFIVFLFVHSIGFSQELKLTKATLQTVYHGDSPNKSLNYNIIIEKQKKFSWSIDSILSTYDKKIQFNIVKIDNINSPNSNYKQVKSFSKKDKGFYMITFSISEPIKKEKAIAAGSQKIELNNSVSEVRLFYSANKKTKKIDSIIFEELETISVP